MKSKKKINFVMVLFILFCIGVLVTCENDNNKISCSCTSKAHLSPLDNCNCSDNNCECVIGINGIPIVFDNVEYFDLPGGSGNFMNISTAYEIIQASFDAFNNNEKYIPHLNFALANINEFRIVSSNNPSLKVTYDNGFFNILHHDGNGNFFTAAKVVKINNKWIAVIANLRKSHQVYTLQEIPNAFWEFAVNVGGYDK